MSQKREKQTRKEIRHLIMENETMVLEEVTKILITSKFIVRFLFAITILFKKAVKK